jgi:glycerate dehydrogenase
MNITILDGYCLNPGDLSWDDLRALGNLTVYDRTPAAEAAARAAGADIVLTNKTPMPRAVIEALPDLRYIGVLATGYNIVDIDAARARKIVVTNIPAYGTGSVAQFVFALLLELCHRVAAHSEAVHAGDWSRNPDWSFSLSPQIELAGKTMGIAGYGRIGRQTAAIAEAFGMKVLAFDTDRGSLEEVLRESDVISLHVPLFPETRELINRDSLAKMKSTAFLINTSRGPLVNEADLAEALNTGRIAGAALDVLSQEPPHTGNPLLSARNCVITPHMAWSTREARQRLLEIATENVRSFQLGQLRNVIV